MKELCAAVRRAACQWVIALFCAMLTSSAAFAACSGAYPNFVCTGGSANLDASTSFFQPVQRVTTYPSTNLVTGLPGTIASTSSGVRLRLNGLTRTSVFPMKMALVAPNGAAFVFWSDIGPNAVTSVSNATITLSDAALIDLPQTSSVSSGTFRPKSYSSSSTTWPSPATVQSSALNAASPQGAETFQSRFAGLDPNGSWNLYIIVQSTITETTVGSLSSWDLLFETTVPTTATTTSLTSNANPVLIPLSGNSSGTITATVTAAGNPVTNGTVSFFRGAQALATNVPVNASGQAGFLFNTVTGSPLLSEGSNTITANYNGGIGFGASSGSLTQVVDRATQVTGNTFCNNGTIAIPLTLNGPASVYPSKVFVTGLGGVTQSVVLDLRGLTHPATDDVNMMLVSPTGQKFIPFAYVSSATGTATGANIELDDLAASSLPNSGALSSGTYRPGHLGVGSGNTTQAVTFVAPAPSAPYNSAAPHGTSTFSSTFAGASPNGTWTLYAINSSSSSTPGTRQIGNGWCLTIGTSSDPATTTAVSVTPSPSAVGQTATISALVTNSSSSLPVNAQGTVTFREGNTVLAGPISVGANGVASFTKSDFSQGAHFIDAFYSGVPGSFGLSNGQALHYVDAATTNPSSGRYCNATPITFPNSVGSSGSPYPTRINASGLAGVLSKVTIELNGLTHQFPDDLDLMVTGPNGNSLIALSDVGGGNAVSGINLILDSAAGSSLPDSTSLTSGTFRPSDFQVGTDSFASPAPTTNVFSASTASLSTAFASSNPNGIWTLWSTSDNAGAQGGGSLTNGWCVNLTMTPPQLTISKTHVGNFTQGQVGAQYTVTVGSSGPGTTSGTITVVDTPPIGLTVTGMSGSGWTCTVASRTCTTSAALSAGGTLPPITVTVDVAANATSPLVNSVNVSGGGALGASANDSTIIVATPDLTVAKIAQVGPFQQGGTVTYQITVTNSGNGATTGTITMQDTIPTGLVVTSVAGTNWTCTNAQPVSCTRSTPILAGTNSVITLAANIAANAPLTITNTATVQVAGESNSSNNSGSSIISVTAIAPDLTVTKVAQGGPFQQGGTVTYQITATNSGNGATSGTITMLDTIPTGLVVTSVAGTNWTCINAQPVSCTRSTAIPAGGSSVITLAANIAANAPSTILNTATVQVAGESNTGNNANSSLIGVTAVAPDLTVTKVAQGGPFQQGGTVTYLITVTNGGNGATTGTITMQDTIPTGLVVTSVAGANWTCTNAQPVSCTRSTAIPAGGSSVITLAANIAANAPLSITNTATVQVAGESNTGNNANSSVISLAAVAPDLTVTKVAQGSVFLRGGTVTYLITVTNGSNGPTSGSITMQDTIPTGLTVTSVSGDTDWTCTNAQPVSCSRSTPLAAGANSVITLNANIATNAPSTITNTATVQVAGESNSGNNANSSVITTQAASALTVNVLGPSFGSVVSSPAGINCPGTCSANFADGSTVTLTRQVNTANDGEFVGWQSPAGCASAANSSNATCAVTMTGAQSASARFTVTCRYDADGDNNVRATTDALVVTRRIMGLTGAPLTAGAYNPAGTRVTDSAINAYIVPRLTERRYDLNLDGVVDERDALLLSRALSGLTGVSVTDGLISAGSQRQFWDQPTPGGATEGIKQYLITRCGLALP